MINSWFSGNWTNVIQTACPWLLRYLISAWVIVKSNHKTSFIISKSSSNNFEYQIKELVKLISQERYQYSDAITEFLYQLFEEVDFEKAREELSKARDLIREDFFLGGEKNEDGEWEGGYEEEWMEGGRSLVSEVYCRVNRRIDIK
jgi:translation initiation factor 3 subunit E